MALSTTPTIYFAVAALAPMAGVAGLLWLAETRDPLFAEIEPDPAPAVTGRKAPLLSARRRRTLARYMRAAAGVVFICSLILGVAASVVVLGLASKEDTARREAAAAARGGT
jgi:hypothetical protein